MYGLQRNSRTLYEYKVSAAYAPVRSRSDPKIHDTPVMNVLGFDSLYICTAVLEIEIDLPFLNRDFPDLPEMEIAFRLFPILSIFRS